MDREKSCEVCGHVSHLGAVAPHHIIPKNVTKQAGMPESNTVNLCNNCHLELHAWYRMKVDEIGYDSKAKRFKAKPRNERIKDYESAFRSFKNYKDEQRKKQEEKEATAESG